MAKEVYVVNTCNIWKAYDSFALVGIFTTRKKLNTVLNWLLKQDDICWDDYEGEVRFVNKLTDKELIDHLDYIHISIINLNEVQ